MNSWTREFLIIVMPVSPVSEPAPSRADSDLLGPARLGPIQHDFV